MPLYIEKINGDVNRPTNQPTDQQGEYRAICLFRKLENRKKAEICNIFHLSLEFERGYVFFDPELHAHTKCKYGRLPERLSMESNFANNSS